MKQHKIFHECVYTQMLDFDVDTVNSSIKSLQQSQPNGLKISNRGGWHSPGYEDHDNKFMNPIIDSVYELMYKFYDEMSVAARPKLLNYWFMVNKKYSYNMSHNHAPAWFSAVVYTKVPKNSGELVFRRADNHTAWPLGEDNENNWRMYRIWPEPMLLVAFPAYLDHFVEQNLTDDEDDERISIAFNFS